MIDRDLNKKDLQALDGDDLDKNCKALNYIVKDAMEFADKYSL